MFKASASARRARRRRRRRCWRRRCSRRPCSARMPPARTTASRARRAWRPPAAATSASAPTRRSITTPSCSRSAPGGGQLRGARRPARRAALRCDVLLAAVRENAGAECEAPVAHECRLCRRPGGVGALLRPVGLAAYRARDGRAYVLVADWYNSALRKVDVDGRDKHGARGLGKLRAVAVSAIQPDHAWVAVYSGDDALVKQVDLQSRLVTREGRAAPSGMRTASPPAPRAASARLFGDVAAAARRGSTGAARRVGGRAAATPSGFYTRRDHSRDRRHRPRQHRCNVAADPNGVGGGRTRRAGCSPRERVLLATTWAGKYSVASVSSSVRSSAR